MLRGIPVSQGVSHGRVVVLNRSRIVPAKAGIETDDQAGEEARLQTALAETRKQLTAVLERFASCIFCNSRTMKAFGSLGRSNISRVPSS